MVVELEIKKGWFTGIAANNREGDGIQKSFFFRFWLCLRAVSHRPENETWKIKPWFYFPGFCLFFVSHRNRENIFLVFTFQLIFLYHTDPFLQTGEIFLRFWPKMEFENAVFSISASTNFGPLFHI
jgi:hypothetical protein